jgi:hypothetical protein
MKSRFYRSDFSILLNLIICLLVAYGLSTLEIKSQGINLFAVSDLVRVFDDGYKLGEKHDTINLFGIRGETISGQFVINPAYNLTNVTVDLSDLKNSQTGMNLPKTSVEWNFVGSIPLSVNTPNKHPGELVRKAPARFPDYLREERQLNISRDVYQPVWLTIAIPYNTDPGTYSGKVIIKSSGKEKSLLIILKVYPFLMPAERHLKVTEWYENNFSKFHGIAEMFSPEWFRMLGKYAENMASHRQNVFRISINTIKFRRSLKGELSFDFTLFDQIAQVFWDTKRMDYLETGFLAEFGPERWNSTEIRLRKFDVKNSWSGDVVTLEGKDVVPYLLPALEDHLKMKGWLSKTLFHIQDEPSPHNSAKWNEVSAYIHQYAPNLKRLDAIESSFILDQIEIAVPKLDHFGTWYDKFREKQAAGLELWFYTVGVYQATLYPNKTIDIPLIDSRIMHWFNYKYSASGYLHWGWNSWNENPYADPGEHNGDGWQVYPAKDGVLNSLRWEEMRNGIQDYEYFWMLENQIRSLRDSLGPKFSWIEPKYTGDEIIGNMIRDFTDYSREPKVLYGCKLGIIRALQDLNTSPRIYMQTVPVQNSTIPSGSLVEIAGWVEPGSKVIMNGHPLVVDEDGLFMGETGLFNKDIIKIGVTSPKGSKEVIRNFNIK